MITASRVVGSNATKRQRERGGVEERTGVHGQPPRFDEASFVPCARRTSGAASLAAGREGTLHACFNVFQAVPQPVAESVRRAGDVGGLRLATEGRVEPSTASANGTSSAETSIAAALDRLDKRLARIEESLAEARSIGDRAPPLVGALVDSLDDAARRAQDAGVDLDARAATALRDAGPPDRAEQRADARAAPCPCRAGSGRRRHGGRHRGRHLRAHGSRGDRHRLAREESPRCTREADVAASAAGTAGSAQSGRRGRGAPRIGVLDPAPVAIVAKAGQALAAAADREPTRAGMFGALRALRDADVQRALGFAAPMSRERFGATLDGQRPAGAAARPGR